MSDHEPDPRCSCGPCRRFAALMDAEMVRVSGWAKALRLRAEEQAAKGRVAVMPVETKREVN